MNRTRRAHRPQYATLIEEIMRREGWNPGDVVARSLELGRPISVSAFRRTVQGITEPGYRAQAAIAAALSTTERPITANDLFGERLSERERAIVHGTPAAVAA